MEARTKGSIIYSTARSLSPTPRLEQNPLQVLANMDDAEALWWRPLTARPFEIPARTMCPRDRAAKSATDARGHNWRNHSTPLHDLHGAMQAGWVQKSHAPILLLLPFHNRAIRRRWSGKAPGIIAADDPSIDRPPAGETRDEAAGQLQRLGAFGVPRSFVVRPLVLCPADPVLVPSLFGLGCKCNSDLRCLS